MKKLLFGLLFGLVSAGAFAQATDDAVKNLIDVTLRNKTTFNSVTPVIEATAIQAVSDAKPNKAEYVLVNGAGTYTATWNPSIVVSYKKGLWFPVKFQHANSGASTFNLNAKGAKALVKQNGAALASGDIHAGDAFIIYFDSLNFQLIGVAGSGGGGGGGTWGSITGTLSSQTDLATALSGKQTTALGAAHLLVGNVSGVATDVALSGDGSLSSSGALSVTKILGNTIPANASGFLQNNGSGTLTWAAGSGGATWGAITGTLSSQTDLATALSGKVSTTLGTAHILVGNGSGVATDVAMSGAGSLSNAGVLSITGAIVPTSVNGVVLSGSSTPTLAITGTSSISGTHSGTSSGSNTGDQTITLTGDVTGSGTGSFATAIKSNVNLAGSPTTTTQSLGTNNTTIATMAALQAELAAVAQSPFSSSVNGYTLATGTNNGVMRSNNTPITGTNGQVLTINGSGVPVFATATGGVSFPLTSSQLVINNPAGTFGYTITAQAISANRQLNLPLITGTETLTTQSYVDNLTLPAGDATHDGYLLATDWVNFNSKAPNPMTAVSDITYGGTVVSGKATPTRLPIGTNGYVLTVVSGAPAWAAASGGGGGSVFSSLSASTANNTIDNANYLSEWQSSTLASGTALTLSSTSTAAASSTQTLFKALLSGANANSGQTTYGGFISNTHTGITSVNKALYLEASGGSNNVGLQVGTGRVYLGLASNPVNFVAGVAASSNAYLELNDGVSGFPAITFSANSSSNYASIFYTSGVFRLRFNAGGGDVWAVKNSDGSQVFNSTGSGSTHTAFNFTQGTNTGGTPVGFSFTGGTHTGLAASTEVNDVLFALNRTMTRVGNASHVTSDRAFYIRGRTNAFSTTASVIDDAYTLYVTPPIAGTNATQSRTWAAGFNGNVDVEGYLRVAASTTTGITNALYVNGSVGFKVRTISASTTAADSDYTILCDATSGNITLTLPSINSGNTGRIYNIKKIDASANTISIPSVDGTTKVISTQYSGYSVQGDNSSGVWSIIGAF